MCQIPFQHNRRNRGYERSDRLLQTRTRFEHFEQRKILQDAGVQPESHVEQQWHEMVEAGLREV